MSRVANLRHVPFSKREPHRNPLQRLSDQRRSLVLAGLAVGAVFSAAIFRRKLREEVEFEPAVRFEGPVAAPQPEAPVTRADSGPLSAVDVPPAAGEPELDDAPPPINAAPVVQSASEAGPPAAEAGDSAASSPLEPATGELSAEEASILSVLAQSGRSDDDRTAIAVATSLERDTGDVTGVLQKLGAEGVVSGDAQTSSGEEIWAVTERGVRRLGAQS
jgi:hypothetical protein